MSPAAAFKRQANAPNDLNHKFIALATEVARVVIVDAADNVQRLVAGFTLVIVTRHPRRLYLQLAQSLAYDI